MKKYTEFEPPKKSYMYENCTGKVFLECLQYVRNLLKDDIVYISVDSTKDKKGKQVAAFIVGSLQNKNFGPFLINIKEMDSGFAEAYYTFIKESLDLLYKGTGKLMNGN